MAAQKRDYLRIFLGSPTDVDVERQIAYKVIQELDDHLKIFKDYLTISVPPLRAIVWEQVPPGAGLPSNIILDRFPIEESDIFIFILWKRFGTPTGTRRKDGSKYISGTQEEFEKAYRCFIDNKSNQPIIMVYRKMDDFSFIRLSSKELEQYKRVLKFCEDCEPSGKHPALTRSFLSKDFEGLLRKDLLDTILKLNALKIGSSAISRSEEPSTHGELSQESDKEESPAMTDWLNKNNLSANPFKHYVSENEKDLIKYYVPFKGFNLISNEITQSNKNWLFFGMEGSGKTALKQFITSRCAPAKVSKILAIPYETRDFRQALAHSSDAKEIQLFVSQQIFNSALTVLDAQAKHSLDIGGLKEPATVLLKLENLLEELPEYERALCLLDLAPEVSEDAPAKLIEVLAQLVALPLDRVSFRLFLPKSLQSKFMRQGRYLGKSDLREIRWEEKELKELIKQRMIYYSINKLKQNQALGPLCESKGKTGAIDDEIVKLSEGNPRAVVWLANQLFMEHCDNEPVPLKIEPRTWDKVQLDWWATGRNFILGPSGRVEGFFVSGTDVYFRNSILNLSKRSKMLLRQLAGEDGQICSKQELIRAAWPDVNSAGVTDAALREAVRRLKVELKEKNGIDPRWVRTVHDQGYQLLDPEETGFSEEEK